MINPDNLANRSEAPFNMAIDTLQRLGQILREIKISSAMPNIDLLTKQSIKLSLTKQFFINAVPLLEDNDKTEFESVLDIKLSIIEHLRPYKESIMKQGFDPELDLKLDKYLVKIQSALQRGKYFMPPRKDASTAVGRF